jgi:hypothetical protein
MPLTKDQLEPLIDERWRPYRDTFHTLPIYYFNTLTYPETFEQGALLLKSLQLDMQNIDSQFVEREIELAGMGIGTEEEAKEFSNWKTKALRAQKMKLNQIKLVEAWMLDNPPPYQDSLRLMNLRLKRIEEHLNLTES